MLFLIFTASSTLAAVKNFEVPPAEGSCEKIRDIWKTRREGTPPPMIRTEFLAPLEAMKH